MNSVILTHTKPSQQSSLGTALDPLADKINMLFIYSAFYLSEDIPPWLFWMFIGRDIALVSQPTRKVVLILLRLVPHFTCDTGLYHHQKRSKGTSTLAWYQSNSIRPGFLRYVLLNDIDFGSFCEFVVFCCLKFPNSYTAGHHTYRPDR